MITKEEIKDLAALARMEIAEGEAEKLTKEVDSILEYVGQIKNATGEEKRVAPKLRNVLREDEVLNTPGEYTERILSNAPSREGEFLKVKKIL